jgi:hypothetical protein
MLRSATTLPLSPTPLEFTAGGDAGAPSGKREANDKVVESLLSCGDSEQFSSAGDRGRRV